MDILELSNDLPLSNSSFLSQPLFLESNIITFPKRRLVMPPSCLLETNNGIPLPPEIVLSIVEMVMDDDPDHVLNMMKVSKTFYNLVKTYEQSLTLASTSNDERLAHVNSETSQILACSAPPADYLISKSLSFMWYSEMRTRHRIVDFLADHEITAMDDDAGGWPRLQNAPLEERLLKERGFKKRGFAMLFKLADCAAGATELSVIRSRQNHFLETLTTTELSVLACLVEVIGQGFFNITSHAISENQKELKSTSLATQAQVRHLLAISKLAIPTHNRSNDHSSENWLRECMCVFEDRVQRFGPYFAFAYLVGFEDKRRRHDLWAKSELQQGLDDMNSYELGYTMAYASLQSVAWRVFCTKANCTLQDRWTEAKELVEKEMAGYKV